MSRAGNHRSKPVPCQKSLTPLIERHGFDAVLEAARKFYAAPECTRDGGEFQPGLQVIANDGRLEALIAKPEPIDWPRRYEHFERFRSWRETWGPRPDEPGHLGPNPSPAQRSA